MTQSETIHFLQSQGIHGIDAHTINVVQKALVEQERLIVGHVKGWWRDLKADGGDVSVDIIHSIATGIERGDYRNE